MGAPLLELSDVTAGYDKKVVLEGLSLRVNEGEVVAMLGPNGAGKTTTVRTIFGLLRPSQGAIVYRGQRIEGTRASDHVRNGMALVPQGGRVFAPLSVGENLELGAYLLRSRQELPRRLEEVFALFPRLRERLSQRAGSLSGGERQMLSISRAMILRPRLLLLDEPSEGLSPLLVKEMFAVLGRVARELGTTVLVVEQNVRAALGIASRVYVMRLGQIVMEERNPSRLLDGEALRRAYIS
ncbi:MAG: ABC transporter ATP-binding protein [Candidatus Rokubacteria bacterium]|nr:ABC transporter ATP-binding protein [Candidatus Rokubacteria bacterium]